MANRYRISDAARPDWNLRRRTRLVGNPRAQGFRLRGRQTRALHSTFKGLKVSTLRQHTFAHGAAISAYSIGCFRDCFLSSWGWFDAAGDREPEGAAFAFVALHADFAAVLFDHCFADSKT